MFKGQGVVIRARPKEILFILIAAGVLVAAGGCSKLQASLDKRDTVTLGDVASRVVALEQRVADLETGAILQGNQGDLGFPPVAGRLDVSQAQGGERAIVNTPFLFVRQDPDPQGLQIGTLKEGTVVEVVDVSGDWAHIRFTGSDASLDGWVSTQFIERTE